MTSQRKAEVLERHQGNSDLNKPSLAHVMLSEKDLGADGLIRPLDERIIAAAADALESGQTHYVDVPGIAPLRDALAGFLRNFAGAAYQQGNIIVTAGMQESRFLALQMISQNFDSIGLPEVVHPGVRKALGTRPRKVVSLPVDAAAGYLAPVDSVAAAVAGGCRLLFLESPSRLSGAVYSAEQVAAIGEIISENEAAVIWDQGLAVWAAGDYASLAAQDSEAARVAAIGEAFPGMGLASWFIGYVAVPEAWLPPLQSQKQIMSICTSTASQYGALEASQHFDEARQQLRASLGQSRGSALQAASEAGLPVVNGAAANIIALRPAIGAEAALEKLRAAGYEAADGTLFGASDAIRLNVSHSTADALRALV